MDETASAVVSAKATHVAHRDALAVYFAHHPYEIVAW